MGCASHVYCGFFIGFTLLLDGGTEGKVLYLPTSRAKSLYILTLIGLTHQVYLPGTEGNVRSTHLTRYARGLVIGV